MSGRHLDHVDDARAVRFVAAAGKDAGAAAEEVELFGRDCGVNGHAGLLLWRVSVGDPSALVWGSACA